VRVPRRLEAVIDWLRFDLPAKVDRRALIGSVALLGVALIALLLALDPFGGGDDGEARVVTIAGATEDAQEAPVGTLGFPVVATRNTTRISGPDPTADAAAAALATHPPTRDAPPLEAAVVVPDDGWQAGIAASVLAGPPIRAPVLLSQSGEVPTPTAEALAQLRPRGGDAAGDAAVYSVGGAAAPSDLAAEEIKGDSPAEIADSIDRLRQRLFGREPDHIVIASLDQAGYAMPAAAWAARSGDPVLFSGKDDVPGATLAALRRHTAAAVYILGPEQVVSRRAEQQIARVAGAVIRIGAVGVVQNALLFARYSDPSFGWNIAALPGHGMQLANASRPLDAAAAASLASSGKWGPLLITDTPDALPPELRSFLLDIKPGYETDPTEAVYNHVWLIGDATAIGGQVQAEIDELAELAPVGGVTDSEPGLPRAGGAEEEIAPGAQKGKRR
jgi:hypothetical protein